MKALTGENMSSFDLTIIDVDDAGNEFEIPLMLYRPRKSNGQTGPWSVETLFGPAVEGDRLRDQDVPKLWDDWSGGAFYSRIGPKGSYSYAEAMDCREPGLAMNAGALTEVVVPAGTGSIVGGYETVAGTNDLYLIAEDRALKISTGVGNAATDKVWDVPFVAMSVTAVNETIFVGGRNDGIWKRDPATGAWSKSPASASQVRRSHLNNLWWFFPQDGEERGSQKLVGVPVLGAIPYTYPGSCLAYIDLFSAGADPFDEADWTDGDTLPIGKAGWDVIALASTGQHLLALKRNGLHDIDSRLYSPNQTPEFESLRFDNDAHVICVHDRWAYVGHNLGLFRVRLEQIGSNEAKIEWCYQGSPFSNETPIFGRPVAIAPAADGWIAVLIFNGQNTYLCYFMDRARANIPGPGPVVWHGSMTHPISGQGSFLQFTSPYGDNFWPRLWMAWTDHSDVTHVAWQAQPQFGTLYQDVLHGGVMSTLGRFDTRGTLYFTRDDGGDVDAQKTLHRISVRGDNMGSASLTVSVADEADGFDEYTELGTTNEPYEEFKVSGVEAVHELAVKVDASGTPETPAVLRAVKARRSVVVPTDPTVPLKVEFGRATVSGRGVPSVLDDRMIRSRLEQLPGKVLDVLDHRRHRVQVRFHQGVSFLDVFDDAHKAPFTVATLPYTLMEEPFFLDTGRSLDSGEILQ